MKKIMLFFLLFFMNNALPYQYDLIVIGGGIGGFVVGVITANAGKKVLLIDKNEQGGLFRGDGDATFNTLLYFGHWFESLQNYFSYEDIIGDFQPQRLFSRVKKVRQSLYSSITHFYLTNSGIEFKQGNAQLYNAYTVQCENKFYTGRKIVIATGARPYIPDIKGLDGIPYYTYVNFSTMKTFPNHLFILGGGPQAITVARIFSFFGVKVTVCLRSSKCLKEFDRESVRILTGLLSKNGVDFLVEHVVESVECEDGLITINTKSSDGNEQIVQADAFYVATGVVPNIDKLNLDSIGVKYTQEGIIVDKKFKTNIDSIYAVGNCLSLKRQSRFITDCAKELSGILGCSGLSEYQRVQNWPVARILQLYPSIVTYGITEQEAYKKYGKDFKVYRSFYNLNIRALVEGREEGILKIICDKKDHIIGSQIVGEQAEYLLYKTSLGDKITHGVYEAEQHVPTLFSYFELLKQLKAQLHEENLNQENIENDTSFLRKILNMIFPWFKGWLL